MGDGRAYAITGIGLGLAMIASCAVPSTVACDGGRICPAASVCTPAGCSLPGLCGDGAIEDGEACDHGNRANSDGCSSTCRIEVCPNGALGEALGLAVVGTF